MLLNTLIRHIQQEGYISVADYMDCCIRHYYATRDPFGVEGDFTTAPEVSQIFGEIIGAWLVNQWQVAGSPKAVLCEIGGGRGTLMNDILRVTQSTGLHEAISVYMVETSPVLSQLQQTQLQSKHSCISWHTDLEHLPPLPLFLVANEFFDALPIQQFCNDTERVIIYNDNQLQFFPDTEVTCEISPLSISIMKKIAKHITQFGGAALVIDYGYDAMTHQDTLQALKKHCFISPLLQPGEADITAHVDFFALKEAAKSMGAHAFGCVTQGAFLTSLGAAVRAASLCKKSVDSKQKESIVSGFGRLVLPHAMGALFKVMAITQNSQLPKGF